MSLMRTAGNPRSGRLTVAQHEVLGSGKRNTPESAPADD